MQGKKKAASEYENASTQLVDVDEFRKYMAESEDGEASAPAAATPQAPRPSSNLAGPMASLGPSPAPAPVQAAPVSEAPAASHTYQAPASSGKANTARMLGFVSLVPGLGILAGPAAIMMARQEQQAIEAGTAPQDDMAAATLGLYLGAAGTAISLVVILFGMVS